jgi:recombinational DNA repair ATPase RecF
MITSQPKLSLRLSNWRCFLHQQIDLPDQPAILIDQNGSGKTSLLSAFYSLLTGQPWPQTKWSDHLRQDTDYFGISTSYPDWYISSKLSPSGRLQVRKEFPEVSISFAGSLLDKHKPPTILTYTPTDNYWLSQSRSTKLSSLDQLIGLVITDYPKLLKTLDKQVRSKQSYIKQIQEFPDNLDWPLVSMYNQAIWKASLKVWQARFNFFKSLDTYLPEFGSWIQAPTDDLHVYWMLTDIHGQKQKQSIYKTPSFEELGLIQPDWQKLWQKEVIVGKVLVAATRDDFWFANRHQNLTSSLSRGEMRLFVLFLKSLIFRHSNLKNKPKWWLLDDVYNELDPKRERIVQEKILDQVSFYLCTGTRKPQTELAKYSLQDLTQADK